MVADFVGTTRQSIAAFEKDQRAPDLHQIVKLANLYRLKLDELVSTPAAAAPARREGIPAMLARSSLSKDLQQDDTRELIAFAIDLRKKKRTNSQQFLLHQLESVPDTVIRLRTLFGMERTTPTPILELIAKFGLEIRFTALGSLSGALVITDDDESPPGILVNSDQPQERQRFSAAHEFGHFILGHSPTGSVSFLGRRFERNEVDADAFAGELLVPTDLLKERIQSLQENVVEIAVVRLARMFAVSFQAMTTRLAKAGALRPEQLEHLEKTKPGEVKLPKDTLKKVHFDNASLPELAKKHMREGWEQQADLDAVRLLQEQAVFSYFSTTPEERAADSAGKVYEHVARWVAGKLPVVSM